MLAAFTGYEVIARVPVILHTPLMSGSNFVHGIVLVGAMVALGRADTPLEQVIGFVGVALGAGNAVGGYVVTERMLRDVQVQRPEVAQGGAMMGGLLPENIALLLIDASYLLVAFLFIMGLKRMSSPVTARRGIVVAGVGMLIATVMSFLYPGMGNFALMLAAIAIGGALAWWSGKQRRDDRHAADDRAVQRHGRRRGGGDRRGRAVPHGGAEPGSAADHGTVVTASRSAGAFIGAVSFSGSLIAFGKLQGLIKRSFRFPGPAGRQPR